jgi:hypothetical protein
MGRSQIPKDGRAQVGESEIGLSQESFQDRLIVESALATGAKIHFPLSKSDDNHFKTAFGTNRFNHATAFLMNRLQDLPEAPRIAFLIPELVCNEDP